MASSNISSKQHELSEKLTEFFDNNYFDIHSMSSNLSPSLDEAYVARVLTKLAIGTATVWWSVLEMKEFFQLRRKSKMF